MDVVAQDAIVGRMHPLSHLRTLFVSHSAWKHCDLIQTLAPFIALPSLDILAGHCLQANSRSSDYHWPYRDHVFNLEELEFSSSATDAPQLRRILLPMHRSGVFKYSHNHFEGQVGYLWSANESIRTLVSRVGSTLEELSLTTSHHSMTAPRSFEGFQKLKGLELGVGLLF